MPPHCDSLDGPVVSAARTALDGGDVDLVLPYVPADAEDKVRAAFVTSSSLRDRGADVAALADRWFFETVVRLHRAGEGAPYTGLKPVGLDVGPVVPLAEKAVETGEIGQVYDLICTELHAELSRRLARVRKLAATKSASVAAGRDYVQANLGGWPAWHRPAGVHVRSATECGSGVRCSPTRAVGPARSQRQALVRVTTSAWTGPDGERISNRQEASHGYQYKHRFGRRGYRRI